MASDGTQANGPSVTGFGPYITLSGDGRYLAFYSEASNLVAGDSNGLGDFFILDQVTGTLERVPANNIYGVNGPTTRPSAPTVIASLSPVTRTTWYLATLTARAISSSTTASRARPNASRRTSRLDSMPPAR